MCKQCQVRYYIGKRSGISLCLFVRCIVATNSHNESAHELATEFAQHENHSSDILNDTCNFKIEQPTVNDNAQHET